jgi:hypothetical protein
MKIRDFINGIVNYDKFGGGYFWINDPKGGKQMLAELRGWGHIQNMFKAAGGAIDDAAAAKFQDEVGDWIAAAINEKLEREATPAPAAPVEHDFTWLIATVYRLGKNANDPQWIAAFREYNTDNDLRLSITCAPCYAKVLTYLRAKYSR